MYDENENKLFDEREKRLLDEYGQEWLKNQETIGRLTARNKTLSGRIGRLRYVLGTDEPDPKETKPDAAKKPARADGQGGVIIEGGKNYVLEPRDDLDWDVVDLGGERLGKALKVAADYFDEPVDNRGIARFLRDNNFQPGQGRRICANSITGAIRRDSELSAIYVSLGGRPRRYETRKLRAAPCL